MAAKKSIAPFDGFPPELFDFFKQLSENNQRDWFAANRDSYEQHYLDPAMAYIQAVGEKLGKVSRQLTAVPKKSGGSLMRIYRDTRFSKDKTPYKTNIGIHFRHQRLTDIHAPGFYVHIEPKECFIATGVWLPPREALNLIRQTIDEDRPAWKRVLKDEKFNRQFKLVGESLKSAPRGYSIDHPLIEDLRRTSYCGLVSVTKTKVMRKDFVDHSLELFQQARPLMKFLCDALGLPY